MNYARLEGSKGDIIAIKYGKDHFERVAVSEFMGGIMRFRMNFKEDTTMRIRHEITAAQYERIKKLTLYKILK